MATMNTNTVALFEGIIKLCRKQKGSNLIGYLPLSLSRETLESKRTDKLNYSFPDFRFFVCVNTVLSRQCHEVYFGKGRTKQF